ncbi:hypothetical protein [Brevundimonas sp.]|uniref:hypothetical protein n=1 Tax=Brevundimonas sp. TaxID=1871086 RepID=UPI0035B4A678
MTALAHVSRTRAPRRRALKALASALAFVCLVLFLLAIEQKHAVATWQAVRYDAAPAVARAGGWIADGAADGVAGLRTSAAAPREPVSADAEDRLLTGGFRPADEATRQAVGGAAFVGADIRLENGAALRTRPLRIAAAREAFVSGETFADRWNAPADAQIELRTIIPAEGERTVAASAMCGGQAPGAVALLHRRDRVELMLFRAGVPAGPDAPASAVCGAWSLVRR